MSAASKTVRSPAEPGKPRWRQVLRRFPELVEGLRLLWRAAPGWSLANAVVLVLQGVVPLVALLLIKRLVDALTTALDSVGAPLSEPLFYAALVAAVVLFGALLQALAGLIGEAQGQLLTDHLQGRIHAKSVELDLAYFEDPEYYDHLHRAQQEGAYRPASIAAGLAGLARGVVALLAVGGLLIALNPWIVVIVLALSLPGLVVKLKYSEEIYSWGRDRTATIRLAMTVSRMLTRLRYAKEVRLFGLGEHLRRRHRELRGVLRRERLALARKRAVADLGTQAGGTLAVFGALVFVVLQVARREITLGDLVMYVAALQRALVTIQQLLGTVARLYEDSLYLEYLRGFLELEPRVRDPLEPLQAARTLSRGVVFEGVSFAYPGRQEGVLRGVDLELEAGEVTALVGENGAGKTTLVKLLCRLYDPDAGRILWDGSDLRQLAVGELRSRIAVAFQDFAQFPVSAGENIAYGDVERPRDEAALRSAAAAAGAESAIAALPEGYDTQLGKWFLGGQELSLGQWQKIALARAFYRDAPLIVLDEPTAGLDALAEAELFASFRRLIAGRTALLISHRFSSVRMADRIYVFADGRVVEEGSHRQLMELDGLYARMFNVQARMYRLE